jgi:hypothetical protein
MGANPRRVACHLLVLSGSIFLSVVFTHPMAFHSITCSICAQGMPESGWRLARP